MVVVTRTDAVPLYAQIREALRADIREQALAPGQRIPSEEELAARFGVTRMTVRNGIADLVDEGLLYRRQGVGTFVAQPVMERDHSRLTSFAETARAQGIDIRVKVLIADILPAKLHVSKALGLQEGELVGHVKTLRLANGVPVTVHDAHIPYRLFPLILQEDLEARHLWDLFEAHGYPVKRATQHVESARPARKWPACLASQSAPPFCTRNGPSTPTMAHRSSSPIVTIEATDTR